MLTRAYFVIQEMQAEGLLLRTLTLKMKRIAEKTVVYRRADFKERDKAQDVYLSGT